MTPNPFAEGLWIFDGPAITGAGGFHFPTRMVVIRLSGGQLFLWSPIALTTALSDAVSALGPVAHIVAPNTLHHVYLGQWATAFPDADIHLAPGLAQKVPDLRAAHVLGASADAWANEIEQVVVPNRIATEVVFFHKASGTVLLTDLLQNMAPGWYRGWRALVARLDRMTEAQPTMPRKFQLAFAGRPDGRAALRRICDWPSLRIVMAHGTPVHADGAAYLKGAFAGVC